jgi:hypothetical protein
MKNNKKKKPGKSSVRLAMDHARRDLHNTRKQSWNTLLVIIVIGAGLLLVDRKYENLYATLCVAILTIIAGTSGAFVSWKLQIRERKKIIHILNCEQFLGLHRNDLIPFADKKLLKGNEESNIQKKGKKLKTEAEMIVIDSYVKIPVKLKFRDIIRPLRHNASLFIVRMQLIVVFFAFVILALRIVRFYNMGKI